MDKHKNARERILTELAKDDGTVKVWEVQGEDPNCDMGGPHSNPSLGFLRGKLSDVLEQALNMPGFYQWGYGGRLHSIQIKDPTQNLEQAAALLLQSKVAFMDFCEANNVNQAVFISSEATVDMDAWQQFIRRVHPINKQVVELLNQVPNLAPATRREVQALQAYVEHYDDILAKWAQNRPVPPESNFPYNIDLAVGRELLAR